jgi:hypothetical protein
MFFCDLLRVDNLVVCWQKTGVSEIIYPRSPREQIADWVWLPRFIDKIRLQAAGKLHADYQPNFCVKGFDLAWLEVAGLETGAFVELVKSTITDGEVCDWVAKNVTADDAAKSGFRERLENFGRDKENAELQAILKQRKDDAGLGDRDDIQCFIDFIDADEGRS